ncbi:MAG: PIN domain-containing protein [Pseudomonadota bacterium]|nr:PIN domain-containing protein [Pseudomonadota bacterium]
MRLLANDDPAQTTRARRAIDAAAGEPVLLNDVVLAETVWTMRSRRKARKDEIAMLVTSLLEAPAFAFESRETLAHALALYRSSTAGYAACMIVAKNQSLGARETLSFDEDFRRLPTARLI